MPSITLSQYCSLKGLDKSSVDAKQANEEIGQLKESSVEELFGMFGKKALSVFTLPELKEELKTRNLNATGKKVELVDRLHEALSQEGVEAPEAKRQKTEDIGKEEPREEPKMGEQKEEKEAEEEKIDVIDEGQNVQKAEEKGKRLIFMVKWLQLIDSHLQTKVGNTSKVFAISESMNWDEAVKHVMSLCYYEFDPSYKITPPKDKNMEGKTTLKDSHLEVGNEFEIENKHHGETLRFSIGLSDIQNLDPKSPMVEELPTHPPKTVGSD